MAGPSRSKKKSRPRSSATPGEHVEIGTVVRILQALSGEIRLDKLIETLMVLALEHAGAERGLLILPHGDGQRVEAEAMAGGAAPVRLRADPVTATELAESVLRHVTQTQETVILNDAAIDRRFATDPYVQQRRTRSILCLPLVKQAALVGVLYLESNLTSDVITPARVEVLQLLAAQAAISMENARLYAELQQAEQKARRNEQRLRLTINTIPGMLWSARPDGVIDYVNQRWVEFGIWSGRVGDWSWLASVHPDDVVGLKEDWIAHAASGEPYQNEIRMRRADGEYRWFMTRALPLRDETGAIVRWYGTSVDIQDRKEAEETIRRQEGELRELLDAVPQQIFVLGPDLRPVYANRTLLAYHRQSFDDVPTDADLANRAAHHPDDVERLWQDGQRAVERGEPLEHEARVLGGTGEYRWFLIRMNPFRDAEGRIIRWYGTRTDIDDRKKAEEKVRQDQKELRLLFDFVPQHITVLDANGRWLDANRAAHEFWGPGSHEELTNVDDLPATRYHPDDFTKVQETVRAFAKGEPHQLEVRIRRQDGQYRWYLVRYAPLLDDEGRVIRWYAAGTDIDDWKRAQERAREQNLALREEIDKASMFEEIVGTATPVRAVLASVSQVAPTESTVLITGETGTGKELVARAIHKRSNRAAGPFVSVNCAAIPAALIASELFGHEKGAFTGASERRIGRFELADGGTMFLDEVGDLPADAQLALLRVLQEREFERVGGVRAIKVDVRVIAATNRDLQAAMDAGAFRSDLFYRLNVFPIDMPPLRERSGDLPLLATYFVERYASRIGKSIRTIDTRTLDLIEAYPWPGNVRELQNVIERAVIVSEGDTLIIDESWLARQAQALPTGPLAHELATREREMIVSALTHSKGKVSGRSGAATRLGIRPLAPQATARDLRSR